MGSTAARGCFALVVAVLCFAPFPAVFSQSQPTVVTFRIIVVESRDTAERVLDQLRGGENFVALAFRVSVDPSATNGGLVGPLPLSDVRLQIRTALERMHAGELSGIVQLPTGFGILK